MYSRDAVRFAIIAIACGCNGSAPPRAAPAETKPLEVAAPRANDQAIGETKVAGDPDEGGEVTGLASTDSHTAHLPHVTAGTSTVSGNLDPVVVKRIIRRNLQRIQLCYEQQLVSDPTLAGKLIVRFKIGTDGSVIAASTEQGLQGALDACVAEALRAVQFPAPGSVVEVSYPFIFAVQ